jgi:hypothetical protein
MSGSRLLAPCPPKSPIISTLVTYHSTGYPGSYPTELGTIPCLTLPANVCVVLQVENEMSERDDDWTLAFRNRPPDLRCRSAWGMTRH